MFVRIHDEGNHVWWGSRLAVDANYRGQSGLGTALIKLAVSSAHALGCQQFLAQVQKPNEAFFQRLNWQSQFEVMVRNHPHVMMQAQLDKFPPHTNPNVGFVVRENLSTVNIKFATLFIMSVDLEVLLNDVMDKSGIAHKRSIQNIASLLSNAITNPDHPNGDDSAAMINADGFDLLAGEGFISEFVNTDPWFAGWCAS